METSLDELKGLFQRSLEELMEEERERIVYLALLHQSVGSAGSRCNWKPARAFLRFLRTGHHQQRLGL
jgi:hypothetical protein